MAKSPRKSSKSKSNNHLPKNSRGFNVGGGKNYKNYSQKSQQRRFSIADSSSSDSEQSSNNNIITKNAYSIGSGSESESSLTAVSERDDVEASRKGSVFFADGEDFKKSNDTKAYPNTSKKRTPKKTVNWNNWTQGTAVTSSDEEKDEDHDDINMNYEEEDEDEANIGLGSIYSMMHSSKKYKGNSNSNSDDDLNDDDGEEDDDEAEGLYSSSDDSDIDFVQLQAERKAKSMKAVRAMKGLKQNKKQNNNNNNEQLQQTQNFSGESDEDEEINKKPQSIKKRTSSVSKPKFGRRKSQAALPEDINFKFDFDDFNKLDNSIIDDDEDSDEEKYASNDGQPINNKAFSDSEEDVGEEIEFDNEIKGSDPNNQSNHNLNLEFDFEAPLVQVPKFKEDEFNSEDDYEIDDNELLATLQADNDLDEFDGIDNKVDYKGDKNKKNETPTHIRNNLVGSFNDDEEFLKEEEKFLVNEFESHGFDDEEMRDYDTADASGRSNLIESFNNMNGSPSDQIVQYASSEDGKSNSEEDEYEEDDDEEEDDYVDMMDFSVPFLKDENDSKGNYSSNKDSNQTDTKSVSHKDSLTNKNKFKRKHNKFSSGNSDEEDDSYLWNYFFSSDNESNGDNSDGYENDLIQEVFRESEQEEEEEDEEEFKRQHVDYKQREKSTLDHHSPMESEEEYDSGESTDVDTSLPPSSTKSKFGSKSAKEVLSSKTADYRPPVLGTWMALDSKPFSIIDGLSTRTLNNISNTNTRNVEPRLKSKKSTNTSYSSTGANNTDDLALGLDELLNISELDNDDENDARIWRDFNNQKKQVPLGAFRNKSVLNNSLIHLDSLPMSFNHTSKSNNEFNQRRYSLSNHSSSSNDFHGSRRNSHTHANKNNKTSTGNVKKSPSANRRSSHSNNITTNENLSAMLKKRRASIVDAVSEGYRTTKSGVFSENALTDVEEILGDDNDLMALIKGL